MCTEQNATFRSEDEDEAAGIDIDLDDPDVAKATTKIQAGFRGMKARKEVGNLKEDEEVCQILIECMEADAAAADIDLDDPEVERATTMIQAGYRGMQARKDVKSKRTTEKREEEAASETEDTSEEESESDDEKENSASSSESEGVDIDLQDPEVAAATTKIQAGYRGMRARKEVAGKKRLGVIHQDSSEVLAELLDNRVVVAAEEPHSSEILADLLEGKDSQTTDAPELEDDEDDEESTESEESSSEEDSADSSATTKVEKAVEELPDLNDPEMEKAATKIQASYRGMSVRKGASHKEAEKKRDEESEEESESEESESESEEEEIQKEEEDLPDLEDEDVAMATMKIQAGYRGMRARKEVREKRKETSGVEEEQEEEMPDLGDPDVAKATTKIQAGYRGMKARKRVGDIKAARKRSSEGSSEEESSEDESSEEESEDDDEVDIDLDDPDVAKASIKIQAGFRGMQSRKEVQKLKEGREETAKKDDEKEGEELVDMDLEDPDLEKATTVLQAGYRGMKARKDVKDRKKKDEEPSKRDSDEESSEEEDDESSDETSDNDDDDGAGGGGETGGKRDDDATSGSGSESDDEDESEDDSAPSSPKESTTRRSESKDCDQDQDMRIAVAKIGSAFDRGSKFKVPSDISSTDEGNGGEVEDDEEDEPQSFRYALLNIFVYSKMYNFLVSSHLISV